MINFCITSGAAHGSTHRNADRKLTNCDEERMLWDEGVIIKCQSYAVSYFQITGTYKNLNLKIVDWK